MRIFNTAQQGGKAHHMAGLYGDLSSLTISASFTSASLLRAVLDVPGVLADVLEGEVPSAQGKQ